VDGASHLWLASVSRRRANSDSPNNISIHVAGSGVAAPSPNVKSDSTRSPMFCLASAGAASNLRRAAADPTFSECYRQPARCGCVSGVDRQFVDRRFVVGVDGAMTPVGAIPPRRPPVVTRPGLPRSGKRFPSTRVPQRSASGAHALDVRFSLNSVSAIDARLYLSSVMDWRTYI